MDVHPIQITSHNPVMQEKDLCKWENTLYSFGILSNSLFTNHPVIRHYSLRQ